MADQSAPKPLCAEFHRRAWRLRVGKQLDGYRAKLHSAAQATPVAGVTFGWLLRRTLSYPNTGSLFREKDFASVRDDSMRRWVAVEEANFSSVQGIELITTIPSIDTAIF